eukprot:353311-Chlamydomonas_euryale.AAC.1
MRAYVREIEPRVWGRGGGGERVRRGMHEAAAREAELRAWCEMFGCEDGGTSCRLKKFSCYCDTTIPSGRVSTPERAPKRLCALTQCQVHVQKVWGAGARAGGRWVHVQEERGAGACACGRWVHVQEMWGAGACADAR